MIRSYSASIWLINLRVFRGMRFSTLVLAYSIRDRAYGGSMSDLKELLADVQDIAERAAAFMPDEASDLKQFSKALVADVRVLADAVAVLIHRLDA